MVFGCTWDSGWNSGTLLKNEWCDYQWNTEKEDLFWYCWFFFTFFLFFCWGGGVLSGLKMFRMISAALNFAGDGCGGRFSAGQRGRAKRCCRAITFTALHWDQRGKVQEQGTTIKPNTTKQWGLLFACLLREICKCGKLPFVVMFGAGGWVAHSLLCSCWWVSPLKLRGRALMKG